MKLGILLFLAACGSSNGNPGVDGSGGGGDLAMPGGGLDFAGLDLAGFDFASSGGGGDLATAYPAGPYGNMVGQVFPPLVWEGYIATTGAVVVNTMPCGQAGTPVCFGPYSADAARKSGTRYAMIHLSEFF
jgi:hypothetical protein